MTDSDTTERRLLELVLAGDPLARERLMELWMRQGIAPFTRLVSQYAQRENWQLISPACCFPYEGAPVALMQSKLSPTLHAWDWNGNGRMDQNTLVWTLPACEEMTVANPDFAYDEVFADLRCAVMSLAKCTQ